MIARSCLVGTLQNRLSNDGQRHIAKGNINKRMVLPGLLTEDYIDRKLSCELALTDYCDTRDSRMQPFHLCFAAVAQFAEHFMKPCYSCAAFFAAVPEFSVRPRHPGGAHLGERSSPADVVDVRHSHPDSPPGGADTDMAAVRARQGLRTARGEPQTGVEWATAPPRRGTWDSKGMR